jgi:hypothetical protein
VSFCVEQDQVCLTHVESFDLHGSVPMSIPVDIQPNELSKCLFSESDDAFFVIDPAELKIITVNPAA